MAIVIYLNEGEAPPDGDRILIKAAQVFDTERWAGGQVAYDKGRWPLQQALQLAEKDAEAFGIATIYVQGLSDAHRT